MGNPEYLAQEEIEVLIRASSVAHNDRVRLSEKLWIMVMKVFHVPHVSNPTSLYRYVTVFNRIMCYSMTFSGCLRSGSSRHNSQIAKPASVPPVFIRMHEKKTSNEKLVTAHKFWSRRPRDYVTLTTSASWNKTTLR